VESQRLRACLPDLHAAAEKGSCNNCRQGGKASREMEHLDNLRVGELTARTSLYPVWVSFKKVSEI
jgi:hypothetical protein